MPKGTYFAATPHPLKLYPAPLEALVRTMSYKVLVLLIKSTSTFAQKY